MRTTYAAGNRALGICQRCGQQSLLKALVPDGYSPDILVHPRCYEPPMEPPADVSDPIALRRPSPDIDVGIAVVAFPSYDINTNITHMGSAIVFAHTGEPIVSTS